MFPAFEDLKITTQTYVVYSNLRIYLDELYEKIECVYTPDKKKAAISKLKDGDIIYTQYIDNYKGFARKTFKKQTIVVVVIDMKQGDKFYNIKIPKSGKIQITGCRSWEPVIAIMQHLIALMKRHDILEFDPPKGGDASTDITCFIMCAMSNVRINIPFSIDRDFLNRYVNSETEHISIFEKSVGYVGVNMKIISNKETKEGTTIDKIIFDARDLDRPFRHETATYADYLSLYESPTKKYKKAMNNSFLVFKSGKTIMSGCSSLANRKDSYETFVDILKRVHQLTTREME